jgi:tetratricopeptide (TPR) repeat protein
MGFLSNHGYRLFVMLVMASAVAPAAVGEDSFAVVRIANSTDSVTVRYYFGWGEKNQQYAIKPRSQFYHYYRLDVSKRTNQPVAVIEFAPRDGGMTKAYRLRAADSPRSDAGGNTYVFENATVAGKEGSTDLVPLGTFLDRNNTLVAELLGQKEFLKAVGECDRALQVVPRDAATLNYRGRALYLSANFDRAIDDFTKALEREPKQAMYLSNRGYSFLGLRQYKKALADFEVATQLDPALKNPERGVELATRALRTTISSIPPPEGAQLTTAPIVQETRLDTRAVTTGPEVLPKEYAPYITSEAYQALTKFRLGSRVDGDENYRLQVAYDKAYEEGRYIDAQEANYIRAIEREPVAALWKILTNPAGNHYYLPQFTPVEERLDGLKRPLVGKGSDTMIYVKSDDDLAGLRIAVRRAPQGRGDGGLETAAIIPLRWLSGAGVVPLDPPDNLRVLIQLKKEGDHAMLGMSFSLRQSGDGTWDLRPEIYTSPKFGDDRFKAAASAVVSPRGCMDCHSLGFNIKATRFVGPDPRGDADFTAAIKQMPGFEGFLADARGKGATEAEIDKAAAVVSRPDLHLRAWSSLRIAVVKLWNAIYYANQPYLDDSDSRFVEYHDKYGSAWLDAGDFDKALDHFDKAIRRGSDVAALHLKRGWIYFRKSRDAEAISDLDQAIRIDPEFAFAYATRSAVHAKFGRYDPAKRDAEEAVRLGPNLGATYFARAEINALMGEYQRSLADVGEAIRLEPLMAAAHNLRGRLLATSPEPALRDGANAVRSATKACELAGWKSPELLETLAAAYAESANFAEAVRWQEKALADLDLHKSANEDRSKAARARLDLYRKNVPYRDAARAAATVKPG